MPLPWPTSLKPVRIENIAHRGITVRQLKSLRVFLQRLCKTGLLKGKARGDADRGLGSALGWYDITMYDIRDKLLEIIPFLDPHFEHDSSQPQKRWYSWAEVVATGPKKPTIMISHFWGGRFCDFMAVIDQLIEDRSLNVSTVLWVCTFANNQFGENLGVGIESCPFVAAVQTADMTILIVDRDKGSLSRSWCCLELHCTLKQGKDLELYTPSGRVGSKWASSGPLVEAVKCWDIRKSEASESPYRRQIMNYIAGVKELTGLKVLPDGTADLQNGRPQIDKNLEALVEKRKRGNGEQEYLYEANLFEEHADTFEELNTQVRVSVIAKIGLAQRPKGCTVPSIVNRGVSLGQLRAFARAVQVACGSWATPFKWQDVTITAVIEHFVTPRTTAKDLSYMELISDGPQKTSFYIDYAYSMSFADVMSAVEWFAEGSRLSDHAVLFFDFLAYRQHDPVQFQKEMDEAMGGTGKLGVSHCQQECKAVVFCLTASHASISRAWRIYAMECALLLGQAVYLSCSSGAMACTYPFVDGNWIFGHFDPGISSILFALKVANAPATHEKDKSLIHSFLKRSAGDRWADLLHHRLSRWAAGPLLRLAAAADDDAAVKTLLDIPGLKLNGDMLKGGLGETALHVAAAAGSTKVLKVLLHARMDPNLADTLQESPLHYAAMAGKADSVQILLEAKADARCESVFGETPFDVAQQNPAGFLGIRTERVEVLLKIPQPCDPE